MAKNTVFACILLGSLICGAGCHNDPDAEKPRVEELQFVNPKIDMKIGERQAVKVNIKPAEARKHYKVEYAASVEGYVVISEASNDGCVLTAGKGGTVVVVAKADGYTAYLEVKIDGSQFEQVPYIMVPTQVIEVMEGARKTAQVNLFNGSAVDQQQFKWEVELGKDNISISSTGNTVVVQGERRGSQKIIVRHDKSEYAAEILVFVLGVNESVKYITTGANVITMMANGANKQFEVYLVNGNAVDSAGFTYHIPEENPCISILSSNNTCNIMAYRKGTAVIRIEHPLTDYPLDVRVIVYEGEETYIEVDKNFLMMDIGIGQSVNAALGGGYSESWNNQFTYEVHSNDGIINVIQANFSFYIIPLKKGMAVLEIKNIHVQYSREVLLIVRDPEIVPPDEYYITTSQNILQLEIGQSAAVQLFIQLINGNEGDKASFEWTVEDGRIVTVEALDLPAGKNVNYLQRSVINRAQTAVKSVSNTLAMVTPLKTGTTRIIISHPKSKYANAAVICKVYPRGTFANLPYILKNPEGGLIKVDSAMPPKRVVLEMASGDPLSVGNLQWNITNTVLANVWDYHGFENEITGSGTGVTKLIVKNDNIKYPYEAAVMVGSTEQLERMSVLYVDNVYHTLAVGQSISVPILNSNMVDGALNNLANSETYIIEPYDKTKILATMIKNRLLLQGLQETTAGYIELTISNTRFSESIVPATIRISVAPGEISVNTPYSLAGPNFIGILYGQTIPAHVTLTDATSVEKDKISWRSDNAAIVRVTGLGEEAQLTAGNKISQTNITVSHTRSVNEKIIVAYVVEKLEDMGKVILGIEKDHWLLKPGEEAVLQLVTNADDTESNNIGKIVWNRDTDSVIDIDYNGGRALIKAKKPGSAVITVDHPNRVLLLKIYISVSDMQDVDKEITLPPIVEIIIGENKVITAVEKGLSAEIKEMKWSIDDSSVVSISGDEGDLKGAKVFLQGRERGQVWITARLDSFGYQKKILVVCARTYDELATTCIMASEESYYRMKIGDSRDIRLVYGSAGFPEEKMQNITWTDEGNKVVKVYANGGHAKIEAVGLGIATVIVNHPDILKPVSIMFETYNESMTGANYTFNASALMIGLVTKKGGEHTDDNNTKKLTVGIIPQGPSYASIEAYSEEPDKQVFEMMQSSNEFILTGKTKGQTYLHIKHAQVAEDLRVLVYAADTLEALNAMFPVSLNKTNYMLTIGGEHQIIQLNTPNDDPAKLAKITWSPNNTGIINTGSTSNPKQREIWAKDTTGNCWYDIKYNNELVEKAFISVKSAVARDMSKRIVTENIIGMIPGETNRKTGIGSNLTGDEIAGLKWQSGNPSVVKLDIVPGDNGSRYLTAVSAGETEVIVSLGQIERYIKVYVHPAPMEYKAVNLDNRYFMLRKNDEMTLQAFHAALGCSQNDEWDFYPQDNMVVEKEQTGKDKIKIRGINEGIATMVLHNKDKAFGSADMTEVTFMVEVNNTAPLVEAVVDDWYMTAVKTVYALDQAKVMDITRLSVTPVRFPVEETVKIAWSVYSEEVNGTLKVLGGAKPALIDLYNKSGAFVDLSPKGKKGTAVIRAYHPRSVNYIDFTVICDEEAAAEQELPYITADNDVIKMKLFQTEEVSLGINNIFSSWDIGAFIAEADNDKVSISCTGNKLSVKGEQFGQALVTIRHPKADNAKKIVIMVMADTDSLVYLTTKQNFVMVERNSYVTVSVDLVGFQDVNNSNYHWETADNDIISINASGKSAVISSKNLTKTASVKVWNTLCKEYYLTIYVRVTDALTANPVYITTANNIISVKEGNSIQIKANLANGGGHELSQFRWQTVDTSLIELNYSGDTAMIKGLKPGTAGITISHDSALNAITILAVIEPQAVNNSIYITSDSMLIEMAITENQRLIRARLVGGQPEDIYGFQWSITNYSSISRRNDGTSYRVIDIIGNADQCYITPYRAGGESYEGEATITVSHPKTNYKLDIKILLQDQTDIKFAQSYITMNQYSQLNVGISAPSSGTIRYSSGNPEIVSVTGTNKQVLLDAKKEGQVIVTAYNQNNTKSDEIIVRVNPVDTASYYYLWSSTSLVTLDLGGYSQKVNLNVKRAKDDSIDTAKTSNIKFRIKEGFYNKKCVKLGNAANNEWQSNVNGEMVITSLDNPGEVEIEYYYDDGPINYKDCPNLKGVIKTIFVLVKKSDFTWTVSDHQYRMNVGSAQNVWARIDGVSVIDYGPNGDLQWSSSNNEKAIVNYTGTAANEGSRAQILALKEGTVNINVIYNGSMYSFPVIVEVNSFINTTQSSLRVTPDTSGYFLLTSYPGHSTVDYTMDTNIGAVFFMAEGREGIVGSEAIRAADSVNGGTVAFRSLSSEFTCGEHGMWIKASGTQEQGSVNIVFKMKNEDRKVSVSVNNMENNFVKWKTQAEARFRPDQKSGDTTGGYKLYYNIDPEEDELIWTVENNRNFVVGTGKDAGGKYIYFSYAPANTTGYFRADYRLITFTTRITNISINLPVFIGYPEVKPVWSFYNKRMLADYSSYGPALSEYDAVQYAITVANGEEIFINVETRDKNGYDPTPNSGIFLESVKITPINGSDKKGILEQKDNSSDDDRFYLRRTEPSRKGNNQITNIEYVGVLEAKYNYFRDGIFIEETRRFLLYAMTVK
jgi:hypothetical protein